MDNYFICSSYFKIEIKMFFDAFSSARQWQVKVRLEQQSLSKKARQSTGALHKATNIGVGVRTKFFVRLFGMLGGQLIQIEYDRNILIMILEYYVRKNQT